jgi:hypothetical protein
MFKPIPAVLLTMLAGGTLAAQAATAGTPEAATETAVAAASKALSVATAPAAVKGDVATVPVLVGGTSCIVTLQRDAKGPQDWLVTKLDCAANK